MDEELRLLIAQLNQAPVLLHQGPGCFYCGSTTHAMASPQRVMDWEPGPLCTMTGIDTLSTSQVLW